MDVLKECRFCNIFNGNYYYEDIDRPITINEQYMALVSIGAMVEGWTLIIPKEHIYSMRTIYKKEAFKKFTQKVLDKMKKTYGPNFIIFEHGANKCGSLTSCGTNHAHIHIVPYKDSLLIDMKKDNLDWQICSSIDIENIAENKEYLFYCEVKENIENLKGYINILDKPESQYFRKLIASQLKCEKEYNYKEYLNLDKALATYKDLTR